MLTYPESRQFYSKATSWGCTHEQTACDAYVTLKNTKTSVCVCVAYLFIHNILILELHQMELLHVHVYTCCDGMAVLEVKCPFSCCDKLCTCRGL